MIPKIIHYCWFGKTKLPQEFEDYISRWKLVHPDFDFVLWNENNSPFQYPYLENAISNKKYANASNFVRLYAVYNYGGIYLDVDFEIKKRLDVLCDLNCFFGKEKDEDDNVNINNAIFGAERNHWFIQELLINFCTIFTGDEHANISSPLFTTNQILKYTKIIGDENQLINDIQIFGSEYFYPYNWVKMDKSKITSSTMAVHHYAKTWMVQKNKSYLKEKLRDLVPVSILMRYRYGFYIYNLIKTGIVLDGPFKGIKLKNQYSIGSSLFPKIVGSYEECLHKKLYEFSLFQYDQIYNIGAGEGYYSLGLAKLFNYKGKIISIEGNLKNVEFLKQNIIANRLESKIEVDNSFINENYFQKTDPQKRNFIFCDVEGEEKILFNEQNIKNFKNSDLIIEIHDFIDRDILTYIIQLFEDSHSIEIIEEDKYNLIKNRFILNTPRGYWLNKMTDEGRPEQMRWIILKCY